ncbi:MAG TPA: hypothetical protein DEV81_03710 [Cyanobacteria bacterium UBA11049]|nr:hypothetical protein [Cyanobacteria bacterium UBA11049]
MQDKSHSESGDIYEQLMAISQEAQAKAHYEAAYHILTAASHYANDIGDQQRLERVQQAAKAQRDWIDSHAPGHRMSTQSATKNHTTNLYDMLIRQASAQILILQQKQRRESTKNLTWFGDANREIS